MIYCVEDDEGIRNMMLYALRASGFNAEGFGDSKSFFDALSQSVPKLVLLDIMLPGEDGISVLSKLRSNKATASIPVIMATAKGTEYDKVVGLDAGADDYLVKPFGIMEMISRVRAVLRRCDSGNVNNTVMTVGDISISTDEHSVTVGNKKVELTLKEFELLRTLMASPGTVFSRDRLLSEIWGFDYDGETRTVDVHIRTLRTKLGNSAKYIETVRGVGYRMEAGVK